MTRGIAEAYPARDFPGEVDDEKAAGEVATEARGVPAGAMKHDGFGDHYTKGAQR
jgi:hypothetical protein